MRGLREGWTKHPWEWLWLLATLATLVTLAAAPRASGTYHFMSIRQIHPSSNNVNGGEWVELQMYQPGQNLVVGKWIRTFDPGGTENAKYQITGTNPMQAGNQRTILISSLFTPAGVNADFVAPPGDLEMTGQDGAVCYTENDPPAYTPIDCVAYGNFTGTLPSAGTPAVQTPFESTLERKITPNCATLLEAADDTNDSATDFAISTRNPRNNATPPTETACTSPPPPPPPVTPAGSVTPGSCKGKTATLTGTAGDDVLVGTSRKDVIAGLEGNDTLRGLNGKDLLCGGLGDDTLIGGNAKDTLLGEAGNDTCKGGKAKDRARTCEVKRAI